MQVKTAISSLSDGNKKNWSKTFLTLQSDLYKKQKNVTHGKENCILTSLSKNKLSFIMLFIKIWISQLSGLLYFYICLRNKHDLL